MFKIMRKIKGQKRENPEKSNVLQRMNEKCYLPPVALFNVA